MEKALRRQTQQVPPLRQRVTSRDVPTLILVGRHDRNHGLSASRDLASLLPGARLHVFDRSAHFPDIEEPEEYASVVHAFLDS